MRRRRRNSGGERTRASRAPRTLFISLLGLLLLGACGQARRHEFTRRVMGCEGRLVLYARDEAEARDHAEAAFARLESLEETMSDYRPTSEISRLVRGPVGQAQTISAELARVLAITLEVSRQSGGALDPTIGPLVELWRRARERGELPGPADIERARARVGAHHLTLDMARSTLTITAEGVQLDLGAVGKGFAAQEVIDLLRTRGCTRALCALAGDIAVSAAPPGTDGWRVALAPGLVHQAEPDSRADTFVTLENATISTAGDAEQFIELGGIRYSHLIDPRTGLGATNQCTVTVITNNGALADALDSAASILGFDEGQTFLRQYPGIRARLTRRNPDATVEEVWVRSAATLSDKASPDWGGHRTP